MNDRDQLSREINKLQKAVNKLCEQLADARKKLSEARAMKVISQRRTKCRKCGCNVLDPFDGRRVIHDVARCCGVKAPNSRDERTPKAALAARWAKTKRKRRTNTNRYTCQTCRQDLREEPHDGLNGKNCAQCGQGLSCSKAARLAELRNSATRHTGRAACNRDAKSGFAATDV